MAKEGDLWLLRWVSISNDPTTVNSPNMNLQNNAAEKK